MKKIIKIPVVEIKRSLIEIPRKRDFRRRSILLYAGNRPVKGRHPAYKERERH